jgi:hypothetical protein
MPAVASAVLIAAAKYLTKMGLEAASDEDRGSFVMGKLYMLPATAADSDDAAKRWGDAVVVSGDDIFEAFCCACTIATR